MKIRILITTIILGIPGIVTASNGSAPALAGIRVEFIIFALTLMGVALFHKHTLAVALTGLGALFLFKIFFDPSFIVSTHFIGSTPISMQLVHKEMRQGEWLTLLNLLGLLLGFSILAKQFELSHIPDILPRFLPDDWKGGLVLLLFVFVLSSFLDNIAAAMIGGTIALVVFRHKVHIGYLAAITAASNAGGSGSVLGDTTTTMMWIDGVSPFDVLHAYIAAGVAVAFFSVIAARQQDRYHRIAKDEVSHKRLQWKRLAVVALILAGAIISNIFFDLPALGVWIAIGVGALFTKTPWRELRKALPGSIFLLSLVSCASMMPVGELPAASWKSAFLLGFVSAVFDNIPLTKLALCQGGYDWGMLAYAVGFGGSMIWFGSSAGVALSNMFPQAKSVFSWVRHGWHVIVAYLLGFAVLLAVNGWNPQEPHKAEVRPVNASISSSPPPVGQEF